MRRVLSELPANWPGGFSQKGWLGLASKKVCNVGFFFPLVYFNFFSNMKPYSVEMACLLGIQNEVQAVWNVPQEFKMSDKIWISKENFFLV